MKATIIQSIQILSLVFVMLYEAKAQALVSGYGQDKQVTIKAQCSLIPAGFTDGNFANIRIESSNHILAGASHLEEVLELLNQLENKQLCTPAAHDCELTTEGVLTSGHYVKQRLLVNGEPLFGASDLGTLMSMLNRLRLQNICY